ncbi:GH3 auxin-responsive promoter family protein [Aquimarina hainanensis]|uniref:GH3 auxin-responsive promoter family protein n=1 Tax=Aquimarina hainanensis TaxID=1578017 RepID=A0ABW5NAJ7_9FLAO|nr:GH3 auxin-responsive promoter family protein [Aquimarina sp. TRL1]QKX07024.1 hypothetical protein HN014_19610 [Aquimarina sp. TRL1]
MGILNVIFRYKEITYEKNEITKQQWKTLKKILNLSDKSEFGKRYDFESIDSIEEYQKRVPVMHYEDIAPYWDREGAGEKKVIFNKRPAYFVESSGTTGVKKLIPITKHLIGAIQKCKKTMISIAMQKRRQYNFIAKKHLIICSRIETGKTSGGIPIGMISGLITHKKTPKLIKKLLIPSEETVNCIDLKEKFFRYKQEVIGHKFGTVAGIPASVVELFTYLKENLSKEEYAYCFDDVDLLMTSGVNYRPYKKKLEELLGKNFSYLDSYVSSEGFYGGEAVENPDVFQFFPTVVFFEFIPVKNYWNNDYSKRLLMHELEVEEKYVIAVTTGNGTFSYVLGDVVQLYSKKPLRFKIAGRTLLTLNLVSEKTSITQVENAIAQFTAVHGIVFKEFFLAENYDSDKPSYCWYFEETDFLSKLDKSSEKELCMALDKALCEANPLYDYFLNEIQTMNSSSLHVVPGADIDQWFKEKNSDPIHKKLPRIILDKEIVYAIVKNKKTIV